MPDRLEKATHQAPAVHGEKGAGVGRQAQSDGDPSSARGDCPVSHGFILWIDANTGSNRLTGVVERMADSHRVAFDSADALVALLQWSVHREDVE